jgi:UDP:flavonoid glycosyltransferase YjiC (YdhE family)
VLQGDFHPASRGFVWWEAAPPAPGPSTAVAVMNAVAGSYGLPPLTRVADLFAGDLDLIAGSPETDPLPSSARVTYVGPILWERGTALLPDWVETLRRDEPVVWVYSGNPRYLGTPFWADSVVVIQASVAALADARVQVVLTTGHQPLPNEVGALPANFRHAPYVPGLAMARRSDLMVHHGGHGSLVTGLSAGTPAVIVPTYSERETRGAMRR